MRISDWSSDVCSSDLNSAWSWTAGVNYDFSSSVGVFARYSRGNSFPQFDNLREASALNIAEKTGLAATAKVDTYEAGLKDSTPIAGRYRSEERRVGKDGGSRCCSRGSAFIEKK